jgi:hypothetical protein
MWGAYCYALQEAFLRLRRLEVRGLGLPSRMHGSLRVISGTGGRRSLFFLAVLIRTARRKVIPSVRV